MSEHQGMALADYLVDKLQAGRKFSSAVIRWNGKQHVEVDVKDPEGGRWHLEIRPLDDSG